MNNSYVSNRIRSIYYQMQIMNFKKGNDPNIFTWTIT